MPASDVCSPVLGFFFKLSVSRKIIKAVVSSPDKAVNTHLIDVNALLLTLTGLLVLICKPIIRSGTALSFLDQ